MKTPEEHCQKIIDTFTPQLYDKYMAGQDEHGGRLWRKPVLRFMRDEIIDLVVYYSTLEQQIMDAADELNEALDLMDPFDTPDALYNRVTNALHLLDFGNREAEEFHD